MILQLYAAHLNNSYEPGVLGDTRNPAALSYCTAVDLVDISSELDRFSSSDIYDPSFRRVLPAYEKARKLFPHSHERNGGK